MKHEPIFLSKRAAHTDSAAPVRQFLSEHRRGLCHAARLLGGDKAARTVGHLADTLQLTPRILHRHRRSVDGLLALLRLENVGDPDRPESGYFTEIDPDDPVVGDICVLTEGLARAVDEMHARERLLNTPRHGRSGAA